MLETSVPTETLTAREQGAESIRKAIAQDDRLLADRQLEPFVIGAIRFWANHDSCADTPQERLDRIAGMIDEAFPRTTA